MSNSSSNESGSEVAQQIFEEFLQSLAAREIPEETIERLRKELKNENFTDTAIERALFSDG